MPVNFLRKSAKRRSNELPKLQGRINYHGMDIAVENKKGSIRRGKDESGEEWETKMYHDYGYIRGTMGVDGDEIDVFLREPLSKEATKVYVVHQVDPETKKFDEDKCMIGFDDWPSARDAYLAHYDSHKYLGKYSAMDIDEFVEKVYKTKKNPTMLRSIVKTMFKSKGQLNLFDTPQMDFFDDKPKQGQEKEFGPGDKRKLTVTSSGAMRWTDADKKEETNKEGGKLDEKEMARKIAAKILPPKPPQKDLPKEIGRAHV